MVTSPEKVFRHSILGENMGSLIGKKAFITGAGQGIGKAIGEELLKAGCDIFVNSFRDLDGAVELVNLAKSVGRKATCRTAG